MEGDILFYTLAVIAAFLAGASKGGLSMVGVLCVPLLSLSTSPVAAAALLLPIYIVSDMYGLWAFRKSFDMRNLMILGPATTLGVIIGWATAHITSPRLVTLLLGVIGLSYCINALVRRGNIPFKAADVPRGLFWGTISGFTSFVAHSGGPPFQVYVLPQKLDRMKFAGTVTVLFTYVNAIKLLPYWALGQFNPGNLKLAAMLSPIAVVGAFAGYRLVKIMPDKLFFRLVEIALAALSVKLIYSAVFGAG